MNRKLVTTLSLGALGLAACGDSRSLAPTEQVGALSLALSSAMDSAVLTTDKPDYAPGEIVKVSGAGWQPGEVVNLLLTEDLADHQPRAWSVIADSAGNFLDSSFSPADHHLGVTFTLTASGLESGRTAVVVFTDGMIQNASISMRDASCTTAQGTVTAGSTVCAYAGFTVSGSGNTHAQFRWRAPNGSIVNISQRDPSFPNGTTGAQSFSATYAPTIAGPWTVLLCESNDQAANLGSQVTPGTCQNLGVQKAVATFLVTSSGPTKLGFSTAALSGVVGQCLGPITVQAQNAGGTATNVASNTSVTLSSTASSGAFFSNDSCTTGTTTVSVAAESHSASFYYKDMAVGTPTISASAVGLTSAQQQQAIAQASTTTSVLISPNPVTYGQGATASVAVTVAAPGSGTPTGTVAVKAGTTTLCTVTLPGTTCAIPAAPSAGNMSVTAAFSGDVNYGGSTSSATTLIVERAPTTTTISLPAGSPVVNGELTVSFAVAAKNAGTYASVPSGKVEVLDASIVVCSATLPATSCAFTPATVGTHSLTARYVGVGSAFDGDANYLASTSAAASIVVKYAFDGFFAPVDKPTIMNVSKAGQAIPLKWRLVDANGYPITNLTMANLKVGSLACTTTGSTDLIEEYATGASGLQNLGDGYYQYNWKTPTNYANSCKTISLDFGNGYVEGPLANFNFKK